MTVSFNSEKTILETLESVREQDLAGCEYIIIDGGSTDGTLRVIEKFREGFKAPLTVISEPDKGIYDAMNKGIGLAKGEYINLLNSDDTYELGAISTMKSAIRAKPEIDIFYGFIRLVRDGKEVQVRRNNYDFLIDSNGLIQHPTCFISKSAYEKYGLYDPSYKICADQDLVMRFHNLGAKYFGVDAVITNFRLGGASERVDSRFEVLRFQRHHKIIGPSSYFLSCVKIFISRVIKIVLWKIR